MKLAAYIKKEGLTLAEFAKRAGLTQGAISLLCNGKSWPKRSSVEKIERATKGQVTASDFVEVGR